MTAVTVDDARTTARPAGPKARRVILFIAVVLGVAALLALISGIRPPASALDPDDVGSTGTKALVEVLRTHGVEVTVVRSAAQLPRPGGSATLVLGNPRYFGRVATEHFRGAAGGYSRVVVLMPTAATMERLGYPIQVLPGYASEPVAARCTRPGVAAGDNVSVVSQRLVPRTDGTGCFPYRVSSGVTEGSSGYAMVTLPASSGRPEIVATGLGEAFTNERILEEDNAGVAVRLLGSASKLVWYQPGISDDDVTAASSSRDPWPAWQWPAVWVLGLAFLLFSVAIGRRLGRLVPEPLAVVVKASETTEARARLYQRTHDRARAATILRHATIGRLRRRLGTRSPTAEPGADPALVARVAEASGIPAVVVADWLAGPPPVGDDALIQLSQQLADLEEKVTHT